MPRVAKTKSETDVAEKVTEDAEEVSENAGGSRNLPFATLEDGPEYLRVIYWGDPGSGKTTSALLASKLGGSIFVVDVEQRLKKTALIKRGVDPSKVTVWPNPGKPSPITYVTLNKLVRQLKKAFSEDPNVYTTIVIDSGTELSNKFITDAGDNRIKTKGITDPFEKFDQDFRDNSTAAKQFRRLLRDLRALPCHLVITAHKRRDEDQDTKKVTYGPAVSPAIQVDLTGQMDVIVYTRAAEGRKPYRALVRGSSRYVVKDAFDALPELLAEPSLDRIYEYVFGDLTEDNDSVQNTLKRKDTEEEDED